jgi:hypothetical protein
MQHFSESWFVCVPLLWCAFFFVGPQALELLRKNPAGAIPIILKVRLTCFVLFGLFCQFRLARSALIGPLPSLPPHPDSNSALEREGRGVEEGA